MSDTEQSGQQAEGHHIAQATDGSTAIVADQVTYTPTEEVEKAVGRRYSGPKRPSRVE